jgi:hypothetical protein
MRDCARPVEYVRTTAPVVARRRAIGQSGQSVAMITGLRQHTDRRESHHVEANQPSRVPRYAHDSLAYASRPEEYPQE